MTQPEQKKCDYCLGEGFRMEYDGSPGYLVQNECGKCKGTGLLPSPSREPEKKCCEKCRQIIRDVLHGGIGAVYCADSSCPCHTPPPQEKPESWEERFDREIALVNTVHDDADIHNAEIKAFIRSIAESEREAGKKDEQNRFTETNVRSLIELALSELEEYGDLHDEGCPCIMEEPDECDCDMGGMKEFVQEKMREVDRWWIVNAEAHRKHCSPAGNKILTRLMGKQNRPTTSAFQSGRESLAKEMSETKDMKPLLAYLLGILTVLAVIDIVLIINEHLP